MKVSDYEVTETEPANFWILSIALFLLGLSAGRLSFFFYLIR